MPGPLTNSDKTYTMMSFFLMFLVNRPRLCLCMLKKAVVAYWFDISWPLKFSSKESDFIAPLAPLRFCKSMKEILYQICHEFYSEGKYCERICTNLRSNSMEWANFPHWTGPAWVLRRKPSHSGKRPVPSGRTYIYRLGS